MDAILDTTVIVHLFRNYTPAVDWLDKSERYGVTSITWLEVVSGASSKAKLKTCKNILKQFSVVYPNSNDQQWAMQQLEIYQFSHRIGMSDCLIASVAHRLQIPLYTHNLKHMTPLLGALAIKPYS